ncbi:MAG: hypothetical protein AB1401_00410 [Thermodesulfobacteriota bacterium]
MNVREIPPSYEYAVTETLANLRSEQEKEYLIKILEEVSTRGESQTLHELEEIKYIERPVDIETFVTEPYYLGTHGVDLYPKLKDDLIELFEGKYNIVILSGSIGWGKDFFTSFVISRLLYEVSCLRNPQRTYGLAQDSSLVFLNLSINATKARKVLFKEIATKIKASQYFKEKFPYESHIMSELRFPKDVRVEPGNSLETSIIGENVFGTAIDEVNFMAYVEGSKMARGRKVYDQAELLFSAAQRRMKSRLPLGDPPGMLIALSSKQYPDDFIERKKDELRDDPKVFVREYAEWETKPASRYLGKTFKVEVSGRHGMSRVLVGNEENIEGKVIDVPIEYRHDFETDLEGSIRDIAGISVLSVEPFIMQRNKIYDCIQNEREHPFTMVESTLQDGGSIRREILCEHDEELGRWTPRMNPEARRFIHIDPSLSGDATGFAMGHVYKYVNVVRTGRVRQPNEDEQESSRSEIHVEFAPVIYIDFMLRIIPPPGGEIILGDVRTLVYELSVLGFKIHTVSLDSFQSADSLQQLGQKGYNTELLSVDTDITPYSMTKMALYEDRLMLYNYEWVRYGRTYGIVEELKRLEHNKKKRKVDHPAQYWKDLGDSLAGVVYHCETKRHDEPVGPSKGYTDDERGVEFLERKHR